MSSYFGGCFVVPLRSRRLASCYQWAIADPVALGPARRSLPIQQSGSVMDGEGGNGNASNEALPWLPFFSAVLLVVFLAHAVIGWLRPEVMLGLRFYPAISSTRVLAKMSASISLV
jgi:hypothetical protein